MTAILRPRAGGLAAAALALAAFVASASACAGARSRPAAAQAGPLAAQRRAFPVPGHGAVELPVPTGWTAEAPPEDAEGPRTIRLAAPGGGFVALVTPFFNPGAGDAPMDGVDTARLFAELARRNALAGAAEPEVPLHPISGHDASGFWFAATDGALAGKEPGPEEWRHVIQGAMAVGPLVVAFTLLDNADGPQRPALLAMVAAARHLDEAKAKAGPPAGGADAPEPGLEPDPGARTVPLRVDVAGKPWGVLVDLPGFRMFKPQRSEDGRGVLVLGEDPASGIVASVILRPAGAAQDARACRDGDLPRIREASRGLSELSVAAAGEAARASYALASPGSAPARQRHGHVWLERDGVCANVHVSKLDPGPDDGAAMERILASARFGEDL